MVSVHAGGEGWGEEVRIRGGCKPSPYPSPLALIVCEPNVEGKGEGTKPVGAKSFSRWGAELLGLPAGERGR